MPSHRRRIHRSRKSRKPLLIVGFLVAVVAIAVVAYAVINSGGSSSPSIPSNSKVLFITSMGNITIQLRDDMPITTGNFKNLVQQGIYDNTTFHRVVADFMIQGGDPTGTGYGDPSIPSIQDEFTSNNKNEGGTIAMANKGKDYPNSGSSQFFINLMYNSQLDTLHPVFGRVIEGLDVADAISQVPVVADPISGEVSRPAQNVTIIKAEILD